MKLTFKSRNRRAEIELQMSRNRTLNKSRNRTLNEIEL